MGLEGWNAAHDDLYQSDFTGNTYAYQSQAASLRQTATDRLRKHTIVFENPARLVAEAKTPEESETWNKWSSLSWRTWSFLWPMSLTARTFSVWFYATISNEDLDVSLQINPSGAPPHTYETWAAGTAEYGPLTVSILPQQRGKVATMTFFYRGYVDPAAPDGNTGQVNGVVSVIDNNYSRFTENGNWPAVAGHRVNPHVAIRFYSDGAPTWAAPTSDYKHLISCPGDGNAGDAWVYPRDQEESIPSNQFWRTYDMTLLEIQSIRREES